MYLLLPLLLLASSFSETISSPNATATNARQEALKAEFQDALKSEDGAHLNVSVLSSGPEAALLANSLSFLAASMNDISLENNITVNTIKLLTTPGSMRASLYQVVRSIATSFRVAHSSMLAIDLNLRDVPLLITTLIKAIAQPNEKASAFLMKLQMTNFNRIVEKCTAEAIAADQEFNKTTELITELTQVMTAMGGLNENRTYTVRNILLSLEAQKKSEDELKNQILADIITVNKKVMESDEFFKKTVSEIKNRGFFSRLFRSSSSDASIVSNTGALLSEQLEQLHQLRLKSIEGQRTLADVAMKIANTKREELGLKEIALYMAKGVETLAEIQKSWGRLAVFFTTMKQVITGPITRDLGTVQEFTNNADDLQGSSFVLEELGKTGLRAALMCSTVARTAKIYNDISKKFVLPVLDGAVTQNTLSTEESQKKLREYSKTMDNVTVRVHSFIKEKLEAAHAKSEEEKQAFTDKLVSIIGSNSS